MLALTLRASESSIHFYLIALDYIFISPQQQLGCISNSLPCNYEASRPFSAAPE